MELTAVVTVTAAIRGAFKFVRIVLTGAQRRRHKRVTLAL